MYLLCSPAPLPRPPASKEWSDMDQSEGIHSLDTETRRRTGGLLNGEHKGDGRLRGQGREGTPEGVSCLLAPAPTETQGELGSIGGDSHGRSASCPVNPPAHFTWAFPDGAAGRGQFHQSSLWPTSQYCSSVFPTSQRIQRCR